MLVREIQKEFRARQSLLKLGRWEMGEEGLCSSSISAKHGSSPAHLSSCSLSHCFPTTWPSFFRELLMLIPAPGHLHLLFMFGEHEIHI